MKNLERILVRTKGGSCSVVMVTRIDASNMMTSSDGDHPDPILDDNVTGDYVVDDGDL